MAALMTSEINSANRIYLFLEECRRMKIEVLPPDINESGTDFTVVDSKIRFGLRGIKNVPCVYGLLFNLDLKLKCSKIKIVYF